MDIKNRTPLVVAITGASGSIYGLRFVKAVTELGQPITLTLSHAAGLVIKEELGIDVDVKNSTCLAKLFDSNTCELISYYPEHEMIPPPAFSPIPPPVSPPTADIDPTDRQTGGGTKGQSASGRYAGGGMTAPIASGSYPTRGMVVIPTSTTCFAKIANGISDGLIERAAECTIKEGRKLVIVPRETPLSAIHLENLLKLARLGVSVVPAIPAFYSGAQRIEELVDFVIGKVLDQLEIPHTLYRRWTGSEYFLSLQNRSDGEK